MKLHLVHHLGLQELDLLDEAVGLLRLLTCQGDMIMAKIDDIKAAQTAQSEAIAEIGTDLADLLSRVTPTGGLTEEEATEVLGGAQAIAERLQSLASQHTP